MRVSSELYILSVCFTMGLSTMAYSIERRHLNLTAKTYSPGSKPLTECPQTDDERVWRLRQIYQQDTCPEKRTFYFCGKDPNNHFMAEGCFPPHVCAEGSKNAIRLALNDDLSTVSLQCVQCEESRIQQVPHNSSNRFTSKCDDSKMTSEFYIKIPTMILIQERWPTKFDLYACNYKRGYSNHFKTSLCDVNSFCECVQTVKCLDKHRPELLPNGSCDAECHVERDPFGNFSCSRGELDESTTTTAATETSQPVIGSTSKQTTADDDGDLSVGVIIAIILIVGCIIFLGIALCWKFRRQILSLGRDQENTEPKRVEGGQPEDEPLNGDITNNRRSMLEAVEDCLISNFDKFCCYRFSQGINPREPTTVIYREKMDRKIEMNGENNIFNENHINIIHVNAKQAADNSDDDQEDSPQTQDQRMQTLKGMSTECIAYIDDDQDHSPNSPDQRIQNLK